jgi:hypothetical protein
VAAYPGGGEPVRAPGDVLGPLKVHAPDGTVWSFLGMFAIFDTPFEVTASELAIELLFPADQATEDGLEAALRERGLGE